MILLSILKWNRPPSWKVGSQKASVAAGEHLPPRNLWPCGWRGPLGRLLLVFCRGLWLLRVRSGVLFAISALQKFDREKPSDGPPSLSMNEV